MTPRRNQTPVIAATIIVSCLVHAAAFLWPHRTAADSVPSLHARLAMSTVPVAAARVMEPDRIMEHTAHAVAAPPNADAPAPSRAASAQEAQADFVPLIAVRYYTTRELTIAPQPRDDAMLDPPELKAFVASGKVVLKLWIDATGEVQNADVEDSDLPGVFGRAAIASFKRVRFVPGQLHGQPVGTVMTIEVRYDDDRAPAPILIASVPVVR